MWKAKCHRPLIRQIHLTLASLLKLTQVFFLWVPAHAMIYGNEVADYLAKRGAKAASFSALQIKSASMTSSRQPSQPQLQKIARPPHASAPSSNAPQSSLVRRHLEGVHARARQATPGMLVLTTPSINLQRKNEPLLSAPMGPL